MPKIMKGRFLKFAKVASSISLGMICHKGPQNFALICWTSLRRKELVELHLRDGLAAHDLRDAGMLLAG